MNPNSSEQPNISLPPPTIGNENLGAPEQRVAAPAVSPETWHQPGVTAPPPTAVPAPPAVNPVYTPPPVMPTDPAQDPTFTPSTAVDSDRIEKEWVTKAKQIIYTTRNDPAAQSKQVNRIKADYLKKRFNMDLKLKD